MQLLFVMASIAAFAASAISLTTTPALRARDDLPIEITLNQVSGTLIKAVVKNAANQELSLLKSNFFNGQALTKKVSIYCNGLELPFEGIRLRYKTSDLSPDAFVHLAPATIFEQTFDVASTTDLSGGGNITIRAEGFVPYTNGTALSGSIPYGSNDLVIDVDAQAAAKSFEVAKSFGKRAKLTSCNGNQRSENLKVLSDGTDLATRAANEAENGSISRFQEYFKTSSSSSRAAVAERFRAVANESSSSTSGAITYYCSDPFHLCADYVLAYTIVGENAVVNCPSYYTDLPLLSAVCHDQDRVTTTLHEFTHAPGVYSPPTDDFAYGYYAVMHLTSHLAMANADTYALFANGNAARPSMFE